MSNPDSSVVGNLSTIGILATLAAIIIAFLFTCKGKSYFNYLLYGGFPILIYLLASIINILAQHLSSKSNNLSFIIVIIYFLCSYSYCICHCPYVFKNKR